MSRAPLADLVSKGHWLVRAANGDYLDVEYDAKTGAPRLVTVPIYQVRHAFRISQLRDTRQRTWSVLVDPVPVAGVPDAAGNGAVAVKGRGTIAARSTARGAAGGAASRGVATLRAPGRAKPSAPRQALQLPMQLRHRGCLNFDIAPLPPRAAASMLLASPAQSTAQSAAQSAAQSVGAAALGALLGELPIKAQQLTLDITPAVLALTNSGVDYPSFVGDQKHAFEYLAKKVSVPLRSPKFRADMLVPFKCPPNIPEKAWEAVTSQLTAESGARDTCDRYFTAMHTFVQDVFTAKNGVVETVGGLVQLDAGASLQLAIGGCFHAMASAVGGLGFSGSGLLGGALNVAFEVMLKDRSPDARDMVVVMSKLRDGLSGTYTATVKAIKEMRGAAMNDWGKLQALQEMLKGSTDDLQKAQDEGKLLDAASRALEIEIWKAVLKLKWHHVTSANGPYFRPQYRKEDAAAYEAAHPNYWIKFWPTHISRPFGSSEDGFLVEEHWLGYGDFHAPEAVLCDRLFKQLAIPREEVFTRAEWGLVRDSYSPPYFPGY